MLGGMDHIKPPASDLGEVVGETKVHSLGSQLRILVLSLPWGFLLLYVTRPVNSNRVKVLLFHASQEDKWKSLTIFSSPHLKRVPFPWASFPFIYVPFNMFNFHANEVTV